MYIYIYIYMWCARVLCLFCFVFALFRDLNRRDGETGQRHVTNANKQLAIRGIMCARVTHMTCIPCIYGSTNDKCEYDLT